MRTSHAIVAAALGLGIIGAPATIAASTPQNTSTPVKKCKHKHHKKGTNTLGSSAKQS
jgi:hypothetical protein